MDELSSSGVPARICELSSANLREMLESGEGFELVEEMRRWFGCVTFPEGVTTMTDDSESFLTRFLGDGPGRWPSTFFGPSLL